MSLGFILRRVNYLHSCFDACLVAASLYLSFVARLGFDYTSDSISTLKTLLPLFVAIRIGTFLLSGIYDIKWRYISTKDALLIGKAIALSSVVIVATTYLVDIGRIPRSVFFIDAAFLTVLMAASRLLRRLCFEYVALRRMAGEGKGTIVYGVGVQGRAISHRITTDASLGLRLVGFIDDNPIERGRTIYGHKVLGSQSDLPYIFDAWGVQEIILAFSEVPASLLQTLIPLCKKHGVTLRRLAEFSLPTSKSGADLFRSIELGDLLGRKQKVVDLTLAASMIRGKTVLITGAGGSIGSELSRQVLGFKPRDLILVDHSEFNLFTIEHELRAKAGNAVSLVPALVDVKDKSSLERIFSQYSPRIVIHAAAYKHVQLVEQNPSAAILNNIEGTKNILDLSEEHGVETFVLISTDKAVNPVGVMGATKRVCELLVQLAGERTRRRFCSVRFGNVLGSSGSLIPLLQRQISAGEALTITHPDMTRYFMLIPEAVSLVLRASTIAKPGDVAILDMGEPVKIVDIAASLRSLMGRDEQDNPIVFVGVRPGEKMYEELYLCGNEVLTQDPNIFVLPAGDGAMQTGRLDLSVYEAVEKVIGLARMGDPESGSALLAFVNCYGRRQGFGQVLGGKEGKQDSAPKPPSELRVARIGNG
jgi:FlaA1/EpsC-like NDP-sugar epimerase